MRLAIVLFALINITEGVAPRSGCTKIRCQDGSYKCYSDSCARAYLTRQGISTVSTGSCINRYLTYCTSLQQIHSEAIDGPSGVVVFKQASGCKVTVTGGTEKGHKGGSYSHFNGWKLDIGGRGLSCYRKYIRRVFRKARYNWYCARSGNTYFDERNHFDINYGTTRTCG